MKKTDYTYQIKAAQDVLTNALCGLYKASVLAVAPGGGKTTISHHIINRYLEIYPDAKVVVLTEGQNTLKNQYISELQNPNIPINFTFGSFESEAQVRVGIPQSISKLDWKNVDLLVVDESHNFYLEDMVQRIIMQLRPRDQVLMTGSPTKFNTYNQNNTLSRYAMYYISAEELQEMGVYSNVDIDIIKTNNNNPIEEILIDAETKGDDLSKMMIACSTIAEANKVGEYLKSIGRNVTVSTSKNDPTSANIDAFRDGKFDALIVVGKGILGFNDSMITLLADLRSSANIDTSFQLFARVLRKHPKGVRKAYYRVSKDDRKQYADEVITCQKMLALMQREIYTQYNGSNLNIEVSHA
jgi:superfamily II DNA or RNA helicase